MRKGISRLFLGGGVIAAALAVALPASAAGTWTVSGGTSWSASLQSGASVKLSDTTSGTSFTCTVSTAAGTIKNGTGLSGTGIGTVTSSTFGTSSSKCSGSFGATGTATQVSGHTESIDAISYNSTTGVTSGDVSNVAVTLSISDLFGSCTAVVTGTADSTYTNGTHVLAFTNAGSLTVASATGSGCAGVIKAGDQSSYQTVSGGYLVTPGLTITSP